MQTMILAIGGDSLSAGWLLRAGNTPPRPLATASLTKMDPTIMKTIFQFGLRRQMAGLLLLSCYLAVSDGRAAGAVAQPPGSSASEAIVSQARSSLAEARKTQSDPRTAVGHYLDAADAAVRSLGVSSGNEVSEEARSIYNAASQEVAVLLRSSAELWNRTETIPSREGSYRLRFAAGSRKEGTWDPSYFDFFRTPGQVHEKVAHQEARINDWGGVLVGVHKSADPRKYFLPVVGLAVPVTAALDFAPSASTAGRFVTPRSCSMIPPDGPRSGLRAPSDHWPLISALRLPIIPSPNCWASWRCSDRQTTRIGRGSTCLNPTFPTGFPWF